MKDEWLDEMKNKYHEHLPEVPDYIWQNVRPYIPKPRKNRYLLPFLFMGALATASIFTYVILNNNNNNRPTANINLANQIKTSDKIATEASNEALATTNIHSDPFENNSISTQNKSEANTTRKEQSYHTSIKSTSKTILDPEILIIDNYSTAIIPNLSLSNSKELIEFNTLNAQPITMPVSRSVNIRPTIKYKTECYSFGNKNKSYFFIEAYSGINYSPYDLYNNSTELSDLLKNRKETETSQISYLGGIRFGIERQNLSLRAGVDFTSIYEKMSFSNPSDFRIVNVYNKDSILLRTDTLYGFRKVKIHNYHNLLSIPITVAYSFRLGSHKIVPQIGIGLNLYSQHKGAIIDSFKNPVYFTSGVNNNAEIYKTKIGLFGIFNIQYSIPLLNRLSLFAEPGIILYFKPFNQTNYPIDQKYIGTNLKLGLKYYL